MTFNILAVRQVEDTSAQAGMFPVPDGDNDTGFAAEPADGSDVQRFQATALSSRLDQGERTKTVVEVRKVKADVFVTDQRVVVACEKYDKGGGWVGSPGLMIAANTVSKVRAARRRRGKILLGHVRYPWLHTVGYLSGGGLLKYEQIRLGVLDGPPGQGRIVMLQIELPTKVSSEKVARHIIERAAHFCTAHGTVPSEHLDALKALPNSEPQLVKNGGNNWMMFRFPYFQQAVPGAARIDAPAAAEANS